MVKGTYTKLINLIEARFKGCGSRLIGSEDALRSAVLVPFVNFNGEDSIIFEKRASGIRQGDEICFPGGMIDDVDNNSIETVIRETIEETGVDPALMTVNDSAGYLLTRFGVLIDVYLGWIDAKSLSDFSPNPDEVQKLFAVPVKFFLDNEPDFYKYRLTTEPWVTDDDGNRIDLFPARQLGLPEKYWKPWSHDRNRMAVYKYDGEVIWGLTARIMNTVAKLIRKSQ